MTVTFCRTTYQVIYFSLLHTLLFHHIVANAFEQTTVPVNLSVLLVSNFYVGHQIPMVALAEELTRRGHKASILSPVLEGSTVFTNLPNGVTFINVGTVSKKEIDDFMKIGKESDILTLFFEVSKRNPTVHWTVELRKAVDKLDPTQWDYVVVDFTQVAIMYYIMKHWNTTKAMGLMSPLFPPIASLPPWPSPAYLSGLQENMSFKGRFLSLLIQWGLQMALPVINKIPEAEEALRFGEDYMTNMGVTHPVLQTTVLGFEYPRPLLPLMHYTGPLFMKSYPPLDPQLQKWLEGKENKSVVYISMGSLAELTAEQGRNILRGIMAIPHNYSVVWALRESNRNAIEGVNIDHKRVFIAPWISQFAMLQHKTVTMAILHCGLGGVQEALYNKVPVICVPYTNDQFDTAARVEDWGLGIHINSKNLNEKEVSGAVERVGRGEFDSKVEKMSIILKAAGGTKTAADLVELYAEVGHEHGIPAFARYKWSWVEYYNLDVHGLAVGAIGVLVWLSAKLFKVCCLRCIKLR